MRLSEVSQDQINIKCFLSKWNRDKQKDMKGKGGRSGKWRVKGGDYDQSTLNTRKKIYYFIQHTVIKT
jgi:hypothetical protein